MRSVIVFALICLSGAAGWWLRGITDRGSEGRSRAGNPAHATSDHAPPPARPADSQPPITDSKRRSPYDALRAGQPPDESPQARLARVLGEDLERAATLLPQLLERARRELDEHRTRATLELMVATGIPELRTIVLEAMVSDDLAFDLGHRDDTFRDLLIDVTSEDVGEAALRRLQWEIARGETSDGSIGGYAVLASQAKAGRAFLREMLEGRQRGDRSVAVRGLAATGDSAILVELAGFADLEEDHFKLFLGKAGPQGFETLERIATAPGARTDIADAVASLSAQQRRPETGVLIERLWSTGARRAALAGCAGLKPGTLVGSAEERVRDIVYEAVLDERDRSVRYAALSAIRSNRMFQTERARMLLERVVAAGDDADARDALRETEKTLRRAEAAR